MKLGMNEANVEEGVWFLKVSWYCNVQGYEGKAGASANLWQMILLLPKKTCFVLDGISFTKSEKDKQNTRVKKRILYSGKYKNHIP
jgi:hypothetical protein